MAETAIALALHRRVTNGEPQLEEEVGHRRASCGIDIDLIQPTKKGLLHRRTTRRLFIYYLFPAIYVFFPPLSVI